MNDFYHKYLKYKTKYLEIKYGGSGKGKTQNKSALTPVAQQLQITPVAQQPPRTPVAQQPPKTSAMSWASVVSSNPKTPKTTFVSSPGTGLTPDSTERVPSSTPTVVVDNITVASIIGKKEKLTDLLQRCLSDYVIRQNITKKREFFLNFRKNDKLEDFAHFSFHFPDLPPILNLDDVASLNLGDNFSVNSFHLKLNNPEIIFNLRMEENDHLVLQGMKEEQEIIRLIGCENYQELIKIKNCLETILNKPEFKSIIKNPVVKRLKF
jgi:hypothetical protein